MLQIYWPAAKEKVELCKLAGKDAHVSIVHIFFYYCQEYCISVYLFLNAQNGLVSCCYTFFPELMKCVFSSFKKKVHFYYFSLNVNASRKNIQYCKQQAL